ncbi:hypothetical protein RRG08_042881 [Elysia crispata]|uniref:Uncharacterized protein n=1 Tax=Elysia crispata TaxID=231223 RepID=A0AAE0YVV1_9GAST|nr:hypothetical protein RRG08_042881 [Elysia crispata]
MDETFERPSMAVTTMEMINYACMTSGREGRLNEHAQLSARVLQLFTHPLPTVITDYIESLVRCAGLEMYVKSVYRARSPWPS